MPTYEQMLTSDVPIAIGGEAMHYPDSNDATVFLRCDFPANISQFCDPEWDALVEEAGATFDKAKRIELYQEAQRQVVERAVFLPLNQGAEFYLVKPYVKNFKITPMRTFPTLATDVYIAQH